ncbi:polyprenyl synthetase family protein [Jannaschia donghaensis]|uniref:Farnesyl diphosphate synthase n=1 Tax=Jannaschia donghaensis TaxID=420998 RepID=A0A0M6YGH6_9RHOB|nr:polyprenyl synthetase family protein [Jannaschia donghaensis]CTQ49462.1 Farnesyl diphosphate synthase [Jannaschia donghaensis]
MFDRINRETARLATSGSAISRTIDLRLDILTGTATDPAPPVHAAMRHALLAPGKRLRPRLLLAVADTGTGALDAACAVEMVHAASLMLDDLPCMDDAALRRGRATTHLKFGEATAILAAVALITRAFEVFSELPVPTETRVSMAATLACAIGRDGMAAGQALDLGAAASGPVEIEAVNGLKTATLFAAAARMGALLGGLEETRAREVDLFAWHLGCAFQLADDALDHASSACVTGKDIGADVGKRTLDRAIGRSEAWAVRVQHLLMARAAARRAGLDPATLRDLLSFDEGLPS